MSIYCTILDIGFEHSLRCERIKKIKRGVYKQDDSKPCTCGVLPIKYDHSGVLPSAKDARAGSLDLGAIPPHITRDGRDDNPEDGKWYPWLRVSLRAEEWGGETVILTRKQVTELRDALTGWLENSEDRV